MSCNQKVQRQKAPDWQVTAFLPGDIIIETDCNSGECQSALKNDPPSASNFDPPQRVSFGRYSLF